MKYIIEIVGFLGFGHIYIGAVAPLCHPCVCTMCPGPFGRRMLSHTPSCGALRAVCCSLVGPGSLGVFRVGRGAVVVSSGWACFLLLGFLAALGLFRPFVCNKI